jgi:hypothetical protein
MTRYSTTTYVVRMLELRALELQHQGMHYNYNFCMHHSKIIWVTGGPLDKKH